MGEDTAPRWVGLSRRGLEEERHDLVRLGQDLRESERIGGAGGRLDLRRETLRVMVAL